MSLWEALAVLGAGFGAGMINVIVGSGTLITFPTLLFFGYSPVAANVSNSLGLVAGGLAGSWGYRHELTGRARFLRRMMPVSFLGGITGAVLLLILPAQAFRAVVPVLIALALSMVVFGPRVNSSLAARHDHDGSVREPAWHPWALAAGVFGGGVYGGYFGAAQGVLMMGVFSALSSEPIQRLNGYKNVLVTVVNLVAAVVFIVFAGSQMHWLVALLIGAGSALGGLTGAKVGRRIPATALRSLIIVIGVLAIIKMVWFA